MIADVYLFDEFTAVKRLFEKTQVEYIRRDGPKLRLSRLSFTRVAKILRSEGDRTKIYLLDNGPTGNMPGVYRLNENGEINPYRLYVPTIRVYWPIPKSSRQAAEILVLRS